MLLQAGLALSDPELTSLASQTADVCISYLPRLGLPARCCRARQQVGNFLIDLAITSQDERYWQDALNVGRQMLLRSGGHRGHPVFVKDTARRKATSWAFGITGLLSFFRRLARQGAQPDVILMDLNMPVQWRSGHPRNQSAVSKDSGLGADHLCHRRVAV